MFDFMIVLLIQALFIFFIDHKYRMLHNGSVNHLLLFQGMIATMYVVVIPLIASGGVIAGIGYILGSILGTYVSYRLKEK